MKPWTWQRGDRREERTTSSIRCLFDPEASPELTAAAGIALAEAARLPRETWGGAMLWGFETSRRFGPDLLLVDANDRVRAVVELKRGAAAQVTSLANFSGSARFLDAASQALPSDLGLTRWHVDDDPACTCLWHTQRRGGLVRGGLYQIDAYRHFTGWLTNGVTLPDPQTVPWILLDEQDRTPAEAFPDAFSADLWIPASLSTFARGLSEALDLATAVSAYEHLVTALRQLAA
ncbi:hypothetical protein AB0H34_18315 [Saccharopolyspora shandongensis]|uniref:hypothetical protein n=1 Tax=Saccharopolyspora shandongensis TaxID=418495 RepID=UPI003402DE32